MLELAFRPDRSRREPVYRQLATHLRELVATGRVPAGEKLPATRELAAGLALSRNTVNQAYQELVEDGVLLSHVGQGTFVASRSAAGRAGDDALEPTGRGFVWDGLLSRAARAFEIPESVRREAAGGGVGFDFRAGRVDTGSLPDAALRRAYVHALSDHLPRIANSRDPLGWAPLRVEIARSLVARGIRCAAEDICVVSGAQQGLELTSRLLLDPGDSVVVEQPGYFAAALCFRAAGAHLVGVGVDEHGLRTDALARVLRQTRVKLVYTTPATQMPTGVVMSDARRAALLELADEFQTPILEDDYDSELRYDQPALPALKTRDSAGQVVYVGTFSKAVFPGLRLGYVLAAKPLLERLAIARMTADLGSDAVAQAAVMELLSSGALERHVRRIRKQNTTRRDAMLAALAESMPGDVRWSRPRGGHAIWVTLPRRIDAEAVLRAARAEGIVYGGGATFWLDGRGSDSFQLSFVNESPEQIGRGIVRLAEIVERHALRASA